MQTRGMLTVVLLCAAMFVAGCNTSSVDTVETTSLTPDARDPSTKDLASGKMHFRKASFGLAEKHFRKAVELRASNAEAWMGLAASYDQLGRFDFADRAYRQLLKLEGRRPEIINNMGYSQYLRGNAKKAYKLLREARRGMEDTTLVDANLKLVSEV